MKWRLAVRYVIAPLFRVNTASCVSNTHTNTHSLSVSNVAPSASPFSCALLFSWISQVLLNPTQMYIYLCVYVCRYMHIFAFPLFCYAGAAHESTHFFFHMYVCIHICMNVRMFAFPLFCFAGAAHELTQIYVSLMFAWIHVCICTFPLVYFAFLDGYCSAVQGLLDWFEVDLGFTKLCLFRFICVLYVYTSHRVFRRCCSRTLLSAVTTKKSVWSNALPWRKPGWYFCMYIYLYMQIFLK